MSDILKLHVFVSLFSTWVLETELESSGRAVKADNLSAISPAFILHKLEWVVFLHADLLCFSPSWCSLLIGNLYPASELCVVTSWFCPE